jgi:hypothetical protein
MMYVMYKKVMKKILNIKESYNHVQPQITNLR